MLSEKQQMDIKIGDTLTVNTLVPWIGIVVKIDMNQVALKDRPDSPVKMWYDVRDKRLARSDKTIKWGR